MTPAEFYALYDYKFREVGDQQYAGSLTEEDCAELYSLMESRS